MLIQLINAKVNQRLFQKPVITSTHKKAIVFTRFDGLGDFVLWLDSAEKIRDKCHDYKMIIICNAAIAEAAKLTHIFDKVIIADNKEIMDSLSRKIRLLFDFRKFYGATLIQCIYSRTRPMLLLDALLPLSERTAIDGDISNCDSQTKELEINIYDSFIKTEEKACMELVRNHNFIEILLDEKYSLQLYRFRQDTAVLNETKYMVFVLSTSLPMKNWPVMRFVQVYNNIREYGYKCILLGRTEEEKYAKRFMRLVNDDNVLNLTGKTTIAQYISIISRAVFVLAGDTSAIHIAASVNTRSICVSGGWQYGRFVPYPESVAECPPILCCKELACYGCNGHYDADCIYSIKRYGCMRCLYEVDADQVTEAVKTILL